MDVVRKSAEHHFLTLLEVVKRNTEGWIGIRFALSRNLKHSNVILDPRQIDQKLAVVQATGAEIVDEIEAQIGDSIDNGAVCHFADGDVILLVKPDNAATYEQIKKINKDLGSKLGPGICELSHLAKDIYLYQKLADKKIVSARCVDAYRMMADKNKVGSISLRRKKRDEPLILFVEDDRFTSSYATNILSQKFDVIQARTGEDAIMAYIEHAPDMVFLDIHLPGLSGHEVLKALRRVDNEAYVVMLSVDAARANVVGATSHGAAGFIKKPFSKNRLLFTAQHSPFIRHAGEAPPNMVDVFGA